MTQNHHTQTPFAVPSDAQLARHAMALMDLTDLSDSASEAGTLQLCARAHASDDRCAAVCVWPQFVKIARRALDGTAVKVATVVNFPLGGTHIARVSGDIAEALDDGADEIDLVFPWRAFLGGDTETASGMLSEARAATREAATGEALLKVILETGQYPDQASVTSACAMAIAAGADFLKTSTGKSAVSATPDAARTMLEAIKAAGRPVGLHVSGGIRSLDDARAYLTLADEIMGPGWATPATFRFGGNGLMVALTAAMTAAPAGQNPGERGDGAY